MMKKSPVIILLILLLPLYYASSQEIEIVLTDGTQVKGDANYNELIGPEKIEVKVGVKTFVYHPGQVKEFRINGDRYVSKEIELNTNGQNLQSLTDFNALEWVSKRAFLKVLVAGDVSLYTYKNTRIHYFASKGDKIIELIRLKKSNKGTVNHYVGQLSILFSDCQESSKTDYISFNASELKRAVAAYNECISGGSSFVEEKTPVQVSFYAIGGYRQTSYDVSGVFYDDFQVNSSNKGSVTYGLGFDVNLLKRTKRLQMYNELLFQKYEFDASYRDQGTIPQQYIDYFLIVDVSYLEASSLIRYNFGRESNNLKAFINTGINLGFQLSDNSSEYSNTVFFDSENRREREPLDGEIKSTRVAILTGIGLRYKFATIEMRYGFNPELSGRPAISNTNNLNFLAAFRLF